MRLGASIALTAGAVLCGPASADEPASVDDLANLTIEQLGNVSITSVSKTKEPLGEAAAAVYVLAGATTGMDVDRSVFVETKCRS